MSPSAADRDVLLGNLAVRTDLVTPEALAAAMAEWEQDGARSLGQVLLAQGHLAAEELTHLEGLVTGHLKRQENTPGGALRAGLVGGPSEAGKAATAGGATLGEAVEVNPPTLMPTAEQMAAAVSGSGASRYRRLRAHAKGGLGEVFVALDEELQREVALKEIQARHADNAESRQRFLLEAEITGRLEHPGIVPVYGLGAHADGRPYYAMRFIKGSSLLHALQRFHADDSLKTDPGKRSLELRQLLGRFQDVCNAIAYAHSKGVLHRDLKPDNVMLGNYGETLVVDWGLAKPLLSREAQRNAPLTGSLTLRLSEPDSGLTQAGHVLGTPAYMSPEQASGQNAELSPASDVYSLGATLYHLLTGKPPFAENNALAILEGVCRGRFPRPTAVDATVPAPLEAVCLKAMALRPPDRYATAKDLADDLEHWLADEPVEAYREPLRQRLGRWRRRHPALVTGTAALAVAALVALGVGSLLLSREQGRTLHEQKAKLIEQDRRALAQVNALLDASPQAVPNILQGLEDYRDQVRPRLRQVVEQSRSVQHRTRAALALLAEEPAQVAWLRQRLLAADVDPEEMLLLRDRLADHKETLTKGLWAEVDRPGVPVETRFRALVALARFDPNNLHWTTVGKQAVGPLVTAEPVYVGIWSRGLRDVRAALLAPLSEVFRDRSRPTERRVAASVLRDYAADRPEVLADLLMDADPQQYALLFPRVQSHRDKAIARLCAELDRPLPLPVSDTLARRRANAAATLLRLGAPERAWPLFRHSPSPDARTHLLHRLALLEVDAGLIVKRLETETDVSARRALVLSLGEFDERQLPAELRRRLLPQLLTWYRDHPDAGLHAAVDWLLRHGKEGPRTRPLDWGQAKELAKIDTVLAHGERGERRGSAPPSALSGQHWYLNSQGQTMVVFPGPVQFLMGSPEFEAGRRANELLHYRRIGRRFALASKKVTVAQFRSFLKAHPEVKHVYTRRYSPDEDGPIISVTWYEAAQYCRWLSEQEGVAEEQMCYPTVAEIEKSKDGKTPLKLPGDYLSRTGYRLPSEAEWEYACRAGSRSSRYYGSSEELLGRYAWCLHNARDRAWPVGQTKPNDFGLFDMHGNTWDWCQEGSAPYKGGSPEKPAADEEDKREVVDRLTRVLRGGGFDYRPSDVRAALRDLFDRPSFRLVSVGFRVSRTLP